MALLERGSDRAAEAEGREREKSDLSPFARTASRILKVRVGNSRTHDRCLLTLIHGQTCAKHFAVFTQTTHTHTDTHETVFDKFK